MISQQLHLISKLSFRKNSLQIGIISIKMIPIIVVILMIAQLILALLHINTSDFTYDIFGFSIIFDIFLLMPFSYAFHFCKWHRLLILNMIVYNVTEWINVNLIHFNSLIYIWIMLIFMSSISLFSAYLYLHYGCFKKIISDCNRNDR